MYSPGRRVSATGTVTWVGLSALRVSLPVATACCCGPVTDTAERGFNAFGKTERQRLRRSRQLRTGGGDLLLQVSVGERARRG